MVLAGAGWGGGGGFLKPSDPFFTCYQVHVSILFREVERISLYSHIKALHFNFSYEIPFEQVSRGLPKEGKSLCLTHTCVIRCIVCSFMCM